MAATTCGGDLSTEVVAIAAHIWAHRGVGYMQGWKVDSK